MGLACESVDGVWCVSIFRKMKLASAAETKKGDKWSISSCKPPRAVSWFSGSTRLIREPPLTLSQSCTMYATSNSLMWSPWMFTSVVKSVPRKTKVWLFGKVGFFFNWMVVQFDSFCRGIDSPLTLLQVPFFNLKFFQLQFCQYKTMYMNPFVS